MSTPRHSTSQPGSRHKSTASIQKTEIKIHVYDVLPPGRLSSLLWAVGTALLHSGVVINGKEYAYGGCYDRGITGVYWTKPKPEFPGITFRREILHGFTIVTQDEIDKTLHSASEEFLGTSYNILTKNCNHFTSYLCQKLTGKASPAWLNRAASIGVALPCLVPQQWIQPPAYETVDGELLEDDDVVPDESSHMLSQYKPHFLSEVEHTSEEWNSEEERQRGGSGKGKRVVRDSSGRSVPVAEQSPR
ncbi:hypothetical protein ED733_003783 [Metarhizium rileyi]|uniref:PPPDE domain-containing protein n=1 Tax=Metarhizium rileyi (strain RCEF 4871) TaxID=1649241 RepID=A0A5C6G2H5_METRR|nr:hypothetical protein ED733_003783 [Metarhizium rileyi]